jgi:hypothetical protein
METAANQPFPPFSSGARSSTAERPALGFYDEPVLTYSQLKEKIGEILAFLADRGLSTETASPS